MGTNVEKPKELFYVRCLGEIGTIIGTYHFNPKEPPVAVPSAAYADLKRLFDHYEKRGIIAIDRPGQKLYKASALKFRSSQDALENIKVGDLPPPPTVFRQTMAPEPVRKEIARAAMFSDSIEDSEAAMDTCIAMTQSGTRCTKKPNKGKTLCNIHIRSIKAGKAVESFDGETLTKANI